MAYSDLPIYGMMYTHVCMCAHMCVWTCMFMYGARVCTHMHAKRLGNAERIE